MKKLLYAKYNNARKPEYQLSTCIYQTDAKLEVVKKPIQKSGFAHIERFPSNFHMLSDYYNGIRFADVEVRDGRAVFDYIHGEKLVSETGLVHKDLSLIVSEIKEAIRLITDINEKYLVDFQVTDEFVKIFGKVEPRMEKAASICNLDSILDNFIRAKDAVYCVDYEWVFDFPVPIRYLVYRSLFFFYHSNREYLANKTSLEAFLGEFGFSKEDSGYYWSMEDGFQDYVHGKNREYIYLHLYQKNVTVVNDIMSHSGEMEKLVRLKENHIVNLEKILGNQDETIQNLSVSIEEKDERLQEAERELESLNQSVNDMRLQNYRIKRAIRNPFYACYLLAKRIGKKILPYAIYRFLQILIGEGVYVLIYKIMNRWRDSNDYEEWIVSREKAEPMDETFSYNPKISILVPVYNVVDRQLRECIDSVKKQAYKNWELCLADDASTWKSVRKTLRSYEGEERIKIVYREENGHISRCTNSAMELATGEYIALLDCDDVLRPNALYEMVKKLNENPEYDFIYSDEDKINDNGKNRHMPHFKPDWSPDTLMMHMYTCHFAIYRRSMAMEVGGFRPGYEGAQDYDFTLRFTEKTDRIAHIPKVLYHWRERKESTSMDVSAKPYILEATMKTKRDALKRRGLEGELELVDGVFQYRVNYHCKENHLISVIIPSKDNFSILKRCIDSLREKTIYKNYEIIVVDNGSKDENKWLYEDMCKTYGIRYHYEPMAFNFSKMCNIGASMAKGEYYLFLNDDMEVLDGEWLQRMLGQAVLPHTGAVGAKLLYPNGNLIQHVGVINIDFGPVHCLSGYDDDTLYYFARNKIDYNYSAVTAACLMVNRHKFHEVHGFDEEMPINYNDVDLCFRLIKKGYYNVVRNDVVLYHHESLSRGDDLADEMQKKRLMKEWDVLFDKNPEFYKKDPFYNPNLTQNRGDFSYNFDGLGKEYELEEIKDIGRYTLLKEGMRYNIDRIFDSVQIRIVGWAFLENRPFNNLKKVRVWFMDEDGNVWMTETKKTYRRDVAEIFGRSRNCLIGFECYVNPSRLKSKKYRLGLAIGKKYVMTDKEFHFNNTD